MRRKSENPGQKNYDREKNQEALAIAKSEAFQIWLGFGFGDWLFLWFVHLFIGFVSISWKLVIILVLLFPNLIELEPDRTLSNQAQ